VNTLHIAVCGDSLYLNAIFEGLCSQVTLAVSRVDLQQKEALSHIAALAPEAIIIEAQTPQGQAAFETLSFSNGEILAGQVCEIWLDAQVPGVDVSGGPVEFPNATSQVSHVFNETVYYGNTTENTLVVDALVPGMALRKEVGLSNNPDGIWTDFTEVEIGQPVYYKIIIENIGEVVLTGITVSDPKVDTSGCPWMAPGFTLPVADALDADHIATCIVGPVTAVAGDVDNTAMADSAETNALVDDADYHGFNPTAVTLARFEAAVQGKAVLVTRETASELDNLGFNLYRGTSPAGPWELVNAVFIPAQSPGATFGAVYEILDTGVTSGAPTYYRLEDVDNHGVSTWHGPISVTLSNPSAVSLTGFAAAGDARGSVFGLALLVLGALGFTCKRRA